MTAGRGRRRIAAIGVAFIYATCFIAIKAGLSSAPPFLFAGLRAEIAGVALLSLAAVLHRATLPERRQWPGLVALALTSTTIAFAAMFLSPGRTSVGIASVLGNLQPFIVVLLAAFVLDERLSPAKAVALAFGLVGATLVTIPTITAADGDRFAGALLALGASVSLALGNVVLKRIGIAGHVLTLTAWQLVLGGIPLFVLAALVERDTPVNWSLTFVAILLGLALAGTALPYLVWNALAQEEEIGRLTLFLFLVPVFGVLLAALAFGERLAPLQLAGLVAVAAGTLVAAREPAAESPADASQATLRRFQAADQRGP